MASIPFIKFYIGDYIKDTRSLPLSVKGGWVDLILAMWNNEPRGELHGNIEDFARIMSCTAEEANLVIQTLNQKKIFDYHDSKDGYFKIVSRKQKRMDKLSKTRKDVGKKGGNPILVNQNINGLVNQKVNLNPEYEYIDNDNKVSKGGTGGNNHKWNTKPGEKEMNLTLPEIKIGAVKELLNLNKGFVASNKQIIQLWEVFKIQNFTSEKFYNSANDVFSHFINWSKSQTINGEQPKNNHGQHKLPDINDVLKKYERK